jgi:hypothetical protein
MVASAVIGGATLLGASMSSSASRRAAEVQSQAATDNSAVQQQIYNDQMRRLEPFRQFSMSAMGPLAELMGLDYEQGGRANQMLGGGSFPGTPGMSYFNPMLQGMGGFDVRDMARRPGMGGSMLPYDALPREGGITLPPGNTTQPGQPPPQNMSPAAPAETGNRQFDALRQSPGYQFRLQEGINSRDASAASRGLLLSGAQQKAIERYGQEFGSNEYGNRIAQLSAVLGGGQYATSGQNQAAQSYAGNVGANNVAAANARASGYQNNANTWNQALGIGVGLVGGATNWNFGFGGGGGGSGQHGGNR